MTHLIDYSWEIINSKITDVEALVKRLNHNGLLQNVLNHPIQIRLTKNLSGENSLLDILATGRIRRLYDGLLDVSILKNKEIPLLKIFYKNGTRLTFEQFMFLFNRLTKTSDNEAAELVDIIHLYQPEFLNMKFDTDNPTWGTPMFLANVHNAIKTKKKLNELNISLHYFIARIENWTFKPNSYAFIYYYPRKEYGLEHLGYNNVYIHKNDVMSIDLSERPYIMFEITKNVKGLRATNVKAVAEHLKNADINKQKQFVQDVIEPMKLGGSNLKEYLINEQNLLTYGV